MSRNKVSLPELAGDRIARLPYVLRILLENVARNEGIGDGTDAILAWLEACSSTHEIPVRPSRLLMHDTTCGPALADIAGMRLSLTERGGDASVLHPKIPIDVSVDHSIAVDHFGDGSAMHANMVREQDRNQERFAFMKWAQANLDNVRIHPPGTGIMHTINLEQLATVVTEKNGWIFPDMLIGTDSHTPMVNGLGVLGWGVGGLEAEGVMFGLPVIMRIPDVVGVKLEGRLPDGVLATDLALRVTHELRLRDVDNGFVEFFGQGVSSLTVGQRAVVANMAPEMGAQTAYFPIDDQTLTYLAATGRSPQHVELVRDYAQANALWFDPDSDPAYSQTITIDLGSVSIAMAGPKRPQDLIDPRDARKSLEPLIDRIPNREPATGEHAIGHGAVAIAAITSCTNTSDIRLNIAAGLMARKARGLGLGPKPWVKTSFSPGSPAAARYLERVGLIADLDAIGFGIVGFGCMTCIGNSGPLPDPVPSAIKNAGVVPVAVLSGNRNFPGRVHPLLSAGFLASPPLVIAYALAGTVDIDFQTEPLGQSQNGKDVYLSDIWPAAEDIEEFYLKANREHDFPEAFAAASDSSLWKQVETISGELWPFDPDSTYLRRPPFSDFGQRQSFDRLVTRPLLVLGDDVTTDQISPAGAIPQESQAGRYLIERGEDPHDLNVYASRRGNFEVMVRGLFTNRAVINHLAPGVEPGNGIDFETGQQVPLFELAERNRARGDDGVILAGERYGGGSSRDWAAKGTAMIGARAVIASSFERIHRTNLIGMGVLPLKAPSNIVTADLHIDPTTLIDIELSGAQLTKRCRFAVTLISPDREPVSFDAVAQIETDLEIELLLSGGILPLILAKAQSDAPTAKEKAIPGN